MKRYSDDEHINVGSGEDLTILELARLVCDVVGFKGEIAHDPRSPTARRASIAYARQRDRLSRAGDRARSLGITVTVENVFAPAQQSTALPSRLAKELAIIGHSHVKACLDFSHGFINAKMQGADFLAEVQALAPFAKHLHIHDGFGQADQITTHFPSEQLALGQGDLHLPVGWGSIPWDLLIQECCFHEETIFNIELDPTLLVGTWCYHCRNASVGGSRPLRKRLSRY